MAVSPYTMNNLYAQGILDYTPYDLCGVPNVSSYASFCNPYMQSAMQGNLYRNYGASNDSFIKSTGMNGFGIQGVGAASNAGMNGFGIQGVGEYSQAGINGFGGGFGTLGQDVSNGIEKTVSSFEKAPTFLKGLVAGGIIIGSLALCLKTKKKPNTNTGSFLSKLKFWKK